MNTLLLIYAALASLAAIGFFSMYIYQKHQYYNLYFFLEMYEDCIDELFQENSELREKNKNNSTNI